jgi:predicted dehydrogenase
MSVGIVGVGQIATEHHLPVLLAMPAVRVAWIVDKNDHKAAVVARAIGITPTRLPHDLSQLPAADVVLIAIPYGARRPFYDALSAKDIAVYVEKPFAKTQAEHDRLTGMFRHDRLGCGFQRRSSATLRRLREVAHDELFGPLLSVRVEFGGPGTRAGTYHSDLQLAGGGILFEVGVHSLDAALFVMDAADVSVANVRMLMEAGFDIHTEATVDVKTATGSAVNLDLLVSALQFTTMTTVYRFEHAIVSHSLLDADVLSVAPARGGGGGYVLRGRLPDYPRTSSTAQVLNEHWSAFLHGVRTGKPNHSSASATAVTSSLIGQLYDAQSDV